MIQKSRWRLDQRFMDVVFAERLDLLTMRRDEVEMRVLREERRLERRCLADDPVPQSIPPLRHGSRR